MGISIFRSGAAFSAGPLGDRLPPAATFRRGVLTCLLNPKASVFMLAVFPRFVRPEYGPLWIHAATQGAVYGSIALAAGRARGWLESNPAANITAARVVGGLMTVAAVVTAFEGWRSV